MAELLFLKEKVSSWIGKEIQFQTIFNNQIVLETQILKDVKIIDSLSMVLCYFENPNYIVNAQIVKLKES